MDSGRGEAAGCGTSSISEAGVAHQGSELCRFGNAGFEYACVRRGGQAVRE